MLPENKTFTFAVLALVGFLILPAFVLIDWRRRERRILRKRKADELGAYLLREQIKRCTSNSKDKLN